MAFFVPAIMALAHGTAAAGAAVGHGAMAAGSAIGHGAEKAASSIDKMGGVGSGAGTSSTPASTSSFLGKADAFLQRPVVQESQKAVSGLIGAAGRDTGVPNSQPGNSIENPIASSPSFGGNEISGTSMPIMQGVMSNPFGASSQKALTDSLSRNG
jgi:hypothetical protein